MGPVAALSSFFKGYFDVMGRSRRSEFGWMWLIQFFVTIGGVLLIMAMGVTEAELASDDLPTPAIAVLALFTLAWIGTLIPWTTLTIRRFHDMGYTGWLHALFIGLWIIPPLGFLGSIVQFFWVLLGGGTAGSNQYGQDPRFTQRDTFG